MVRLFERLDDIAGIDVPDFAALWLERIAFVFLLLMALSAPHSIAVSQSSWLLGSLATALRLVIKPRPAFRFSALHIALIALLIWAFVSSVFSYEPALSLDKMRGVGLLFVFFFSYLNLRKLSAIKLVVFLLLFSCMFNVAWSLADRAIGRGIQVYGVSPDGPLGKAGIVDSQVILTASGKKIHSADELRQVILENWITRVRVYWPEEYINFDIQRSDLVSSAATSEEALGIAAWNTGRNWRAQGFFSHFTTYAEMLQLIASLLFGLIVASIVRGRQTQPGNDVLKHLTSTPVMIVCLAATLIVMVLTVTRASQGAFMLSAFVIVLLSGSRKLLLAAIIVAIPLALGAILFLQQSRGIGVVDSKDESTQYRLTMWRDGWRLSHANVHNLVFGIGMDSTKKHWQEWGMFDGGFLPMGHFHSTLMQMLVERGIPGLLIWLAVILLYGLILWRAVWRQRNEQASDRWTFGILLGCLGGLIGFFTSGVVHYNIGDGEVAMVFYLLMAIAVRMTELLGSQPSEAQALAAQVGVAA